MRENHVNFVALKKVGQKIALIFVALKKVGHEIRPNFVALKKVIQ